MSNDKISGANGSQVSTVTTTTTTTGPAKLGAHTISVTGNPPMELDKIGTEKIPHLGFRKVTKARNIAKGLDRSISHVMSTIRRESGTLDALGFCKALNTVRFYMERSPAHGYNLVPDQIFMEVFANEVYNLDNNQLNLTYQSLISREMDDLKAGLLRTINREDLPLEQGNELQALYSNICNLEALVLQEASNRVAIATIPPEERQHLRLLPERYCGAVHEVPAAPRGGVEAEMTTDNLKTLVVQGAIQSMRSTRAEANAGAMLARHNFQPGDVRRMGNIVRSSEMTMNISPALLMGMVGGLNPDAPPIGDPEFMFKNAFEIATAGRSASQDPNYMACRDAVERQLFPAYAKDATNPIERPRYAAMNLGGSLAGPATTYGEAVVVFKPHVKQQATYTFNDTFFMLPVKITQEGKERLLAAVAKLTGSMTPEAKANFENEDSVLRREIDRFFAFNAGKTNQISQFPLLMELLRNIPHKYDGTWPTEYGFKAILVKALGDASQTDKNIATFDHIENLFAEMPEVEAVDFAVSAIMQNRPDQPPMVRLRSADYLEAQIHTPLQLSRDVAEIRMSQNGILSSLNTEFIKLPKEQQEALLAPIRASLQPGQHVSDYALRQLYFKQQLAGFQANCARFSERTGVNIVIYDDESPAAEELARAFTAMNTKTNNLMDTKLREAFTVESQRILAMELHEFQEAIDRQIALADLDLVIQTFGTNDLTQLPEEIQAKARAVVQDTIEFLTAMDSPVEASYLLSEIGSRLSNMLTVEAVHTSTLQSLQFPDEESEARFMTMLATAQLENAPNTHRIQLLNLYCDFSIRDNLAELLEETCLRLQEELPNGAAVQELLGEGKCIFEGAAMADLERKFLAALDAKQLRHQKGVTIYRHDAVLAELVKNIIQPAIQARAQMLTEMQPLAFQAESDKTVFQSAVQSSTFLQNPELMKGLHAASQALAAQLTAAESTAITAADLPQLRQLSERALAPFQEAIGDKTAEMTELVVEVTLKTLQARGTDLNPLLQSLKTLSMRQLMNAVLGLIRNAESLAINDHNDYRKMVADFNLIRALDAYVRPLLDEAPGVKPVAVPLSGILQETRNELRASYPGVVDALNANAPYSANAIYRPRRIAAPAATAALPTDLETREAFLLDQLAIYRHHEETFDQGSNFHGRTHAIRAFIYANVMGNILRERGIDVDMNAISLAIAGHDTGRQGSGRDRWGADSARMTTERINEMYSGDAESVGDDWLDGITSAIAHGNGPAATVEGHVMAAADSMDYWRVGNVNQSLFPFLRGPIEVDGVAIDTDEALREQLIRESKELAILTSDRTAEVFHEAGEIEQEFKNKLEPDVLVQYLTGRIQQATRVETDMLANTSDEALLKMVKQQITANPDKFPLLSKYYV